MKYGCLQRASADSSKDQEGGVKEISTDSKFTIEEEEETLGSHHELTPL